jgi:hypothetical protein
MKKTILLIVISIVMALSSCSVLNNFTGKTNSSNSQTGSSSKVESSVVTTAKNALTGETIPLEQASTNRPMGIMVSNIQIALPQSGLSQADICFEVVAEGGITRILALFYNWSKLPKIGTVRSARDYYIDLAQAYDAIYVHFGESYIAAAVLKDRNIDDIDLFKIDNAYWRDQARIKSKGLEHSAYTNIDYIKKGINAKKIQVAAQNGKQADAFNFNPPDQKIKPTDITANKVTVPFSGVSTSIFDYNSTEGVYGKSEFGSPEIDENTNSQLKVTNVIILFTDITRANDPELMAVSMDGGSGYYVSNGSAQEISWEKGQPTDPIKLYANDNSPLKINAGKTWVCIVDNVRNSLIKFE